MKIRKNERENEQTGNDRTMRKDRADPKKKTH